MRLRLLLVLSLALITGFIIFNLSFVSAACPDDQVIMKLYSVTNAHGALWNDAGYNIDVCYSDIFGSAYGGSSPHPSTCSNKVIGLSALTNAHAEKPENTAYTTPVCYGDLECRSEITTNVGQIIDSCPIDYTHVLSLSAETNAHLELAPINKLKIVDFFAGCTLGNCNPPLSVGGTFYTGNVQYTAYPDKKIYIFSTFPLGMVVDDVMIITTSLGSFTKDFSPTCNPAVEPIRVTTPIDITNLFLTGSETASVTRNVNIVLKDKCGTAVSTTDLWLYQGLSPGTYPVKICCKAGVVILPVCGNNIIESGEQCDDGNTISGDGCSATCQLEIFGNSYWANMIDIKITQADLKDRVKLVVEGQRTGFNSQVFGTWSNAVTWLDVMKADVNGDGKDDVIGREQASGNWWVGISNGTGFNNINFGNWNPSLARYDVLALDLNGDGLDDVIGRLDNGDWYASISNGLSFTNVLFGSWSTAVTWLDVMKADVNGDGKDDVIGRTDSGQWWAGISNGTGFNNINFGSWSSAVTWNNVMVADVNGDSKDDVIGRESVNGNWWAGISNGTGFTNINFGAWSTAVTWNNVMVADVNGDSKDDVIGREQASGNWWAGISNGTGFTNINFGNWNPSLARYDVLALDLNGDGLDDVIGRLDNGDWYASISNGLSFTNVFFGSWSTAVTWLDVMKADVNGDGKDDVVGRDNSGQWQVGISDGFIGKEINFTIWKSVWWWFDKKMAQTSSKGYTTWRAGQKSDGSFESGTYYFKAIASDGSSTFNDSEDLIVSASENNAKPKAVIIKPESEEKVLVGSTVNFKQASYDEDDDLKIIWDFGDGNNSGWKENCLTGGSCDTTHIYSSQGTKVIKLTAQEMTRSQQDKNYTQIFIYEPGINVFAKITEPNPLAYPPQSYDETVPFDAKDSFAAECSLTCPAGKTCYQVSDGTTTLNCYDFPKTDIPSAYNLKFNWTFDEGGKRAGWWDINYNGVVEFNKHFSITGIHKAELEVGYSGDGINILKSDKTSTIFNIDYPYIDPTCVVNEAGTFWVDSSSWNPSENDCHRDNVAQGSANDCCPAGNNCVDNVCVESNEFPGCQRFTDENNCNAQKGTDDAEKLVEADPNRGEGFCKSGYFNGECDINVKNCRCAWDNKGTADTTDDVCGGKWDIDSSNCINGKIEATCKIEPITTRKEGGFIYQVWNAYYETNIGSIINCGDSNPLCDTQIEKSLEPISCSDEGKCVSDSCNKGERRFIWGERELSWFGWWQFIGVLILVLLFYFIKENRK